MNRVTGQFMLIGLLLAIFVFNNYRPLFQPDQGPFFSAKATGKVTVELADGFPKPGIHQFIDGSTRNDVIKLTILEGDRNHAQGYIVNASDLPVRAGEKLSLEEKTANRRVLRVNWMTASKRVALGIPLHPDRMSRNDWLFLPGVGPALAQKIDADRQKYGEFGTFGSLDRVPGVGKRRLTSWNQYFFSH